MGSRGLTDIAIRNLKPGKERREIPDPGARGLYVVVQPSGSKSFAVRYRIHGQPKKLTLKSGIALAAARKLCAAAMHDVAEGRDPSAAKKEAVAKAAAAKADTLRAVCEEYLARDGAKLRTANQRERLLDRLVYPAFGSRNIHTITRGELVRLLDKIEDERGTRMADMTLAVLRKVFNWFAIRDEHFRTPIVKGMARRKPQEQARSRVLEDAELLCIWKTATENKTPFAALVKFLLLTAARRAEAAEMTWSEVEDRAWTLPAARNKVKVDLVRPLSAVAVAVLDGLPRIADCAYPFTTDGQRPISGFSKFKKKFDEVCGVSGWTLHDCRRSARSLMSRAGVLSDHAEMCLGHVLPSMRRTYDRWQYFDEKKRAFEQLATLIENIVSPQEKVTALRRR
jgi:integrase